MSPGAGDHFAAAGFNNGAECLLHVRGHPGFVFAPFPMKTQHGDAPLILYLRVDVAITIVVGDHFPSAAESNKRAVGSAAFLLQSGAVTFVLLAHVVEASYPGHIASAAEFNVIAAQEIVLLSEAPPRHVHMHAANSVMVVHRHILELREISGEIASNRIGQIATHHS